MQKFKKDKKGWEMTSSNGTIHRMTAEQLLSHLLPPLASKNPKFKVKVVKRLRSKK
jgi:hypothetical protein